MTSDANEFLLGQGVPAAKFLSVGTRVTGRVVSAVVQNQTKLGTGEVLTFPDGNPRKQLVITLETDDRDPDIEFDDGARRIYAKAEMLNAIRHVVRAHGGIEPGGVLTVTYTGDGKPTQPGFNPPKLYSASYSPPSQKVAVPEDGNGNGHAGYPFLNELGRLLRERNINLRAVGSALEVAIEDKDVILAAIADRVEAGDSIESVVDLVDGVPF